MARDLPMISQLPEWANSILSAAGGGGLVAYLAARVRKSDMNKDATDSKTQNLIDSLRDSLAHEREINIKLHETVERLAHERNEAVRMAGRLEGQVEAMQNKVDELTAEVQKLEDINAEMSQRMSTEFQAMRDEIVRLTQMVSQGAQS